MGIREFKLTGGEPLLHPDIAEVARELTEIGPGLEVSITTNGFYLPEKAASLSEAGVRRINVSIHSLSNATYGFLTGRKALSRVLAGVDAALDAGIKVKVNFVLTRLNLEEVPRLLDYASSKGADVNIIELIPVLRGQWSFDGLYAPVELIIPYLEKSSSARVRRDLHNRPVYVLDTGIKVEVVANYRNPYFCLGCRRIRLTSDGRLKICLYRESPSISIGEVLRSDMPEEEKIEKMKEFFVIANSLREPYFRLENNTVKTPDGHSLGPPRQI